MRGEEGRKREGGKRKGGVGRAWLGSKKILVTALVECA